VQTVAADAYESRRAACTGWMMSAYPTGLDEAWCTAEFALPSAFLIKCARAQHLGFETPVQQEACRLMFLRAADTAARGHVVE
jgi:hypothetical protein